MLWAPFQEALRMRRSALPVVIFAVLLASTAWAQPSGHAAFLSFTAPIPDTWVAEQPTSSMRLLQYQVPGPSAAEPAPFVVYFFGAGQGGSVDANIARWQSQFTSADGGPVEPRIERFTVGDMPVTLVELRGTYARSVGMGPGSEARSAQTLLAAVVETNAGSLYVQLHGAADVVEAGRKGFDAFVRGITPAQPAGGAGEGGKRE